jgi:hypothetical protein
MAHQKDHWRNLGKRVANVTRRGLDRSTKNILGKLAAPRNPKVTEAHAAVASVSTDGGTKPTQPRTDDGNSVANAKFNQAAKGPNYRPNVVTVGGK